MKNSIKIQIIGIIIYGLVFTLITSFVLGALTCWWILWSCIAKLNLKIMKFCAKNMSFLRAFIFSTRTSIFSINRCINTNIIISKILVFYKHLIYRMIEQSFNIVKTDGLNNYLYLWFKIRTKKSPYNRRRGKHDFLLIPLLFFCLKRR